MPEEHGETVWENVLVLLENLPTKISGTGGSESMCDDVERCWMLMTITVGGRCLPLLDGTVSLSAESVKNIFQGVRQIQG